MQRAKLNAILIFPQGCSPKLASKLHYIIAWLLYCTDCSLRFHFLFVNFHSTLVQISSIYLRYRNLITWYPAEMAPVKVICPSLPSWETMKKQWKRPARKQVLQQVIHNPLVLCPVTGTFLTSLIT